MDHSQIYSQPTGRAAPSRPLPVRPGPAGLALQLVPLVMAAVLFGFQFWQLWPEARVPWLTELYMLLLAWIGLTGALTVAAHFMQAAWLEGPVLARRTWLPVRRVDLSTARVWLVRQRFIARGTYLVARDGRSGKRVKIPLAPFGRGLMPADDLLALSAAIGGGPRSPAEGYHAWGTATGLHNLATNPAAVHELARQRRTTNVFVIVMLSVVAGLLLLVMALGLVLFLLSP